MSVSPLTHHDIIKRSAPMTRAGFKVNLPACDRASRYIEFVTQSDTDANADSNADANTNVNANADSSLSIIHTLEVDESSKQLLCRVVIHASGLVSTLTAVVTDLETAINTLQKIPVSRQIPLDTDYAIARSYTLEPDYGNNDDTAILQLRFTCAYIEGIQIRIDSSTGGGMPADVWVLGQAQSSGYMRDTLADGGDIPLDHRAARRQRLKALANAQNTETKNLPDDLLAILGPQWRPLRNQGDHWKGVLRQLGNRKTRTAKAERYIDIALHHLQNTLSRSPEHYQLTHAKARWQVYFRRLQPLMVLVGVLALMPISWLFVSSGTVSIHPLALGLTPLLMVGVVALTAREIPVMEIPPRPQVLPDDAWTRHANDQSPRTESALTTAEPQ